MNLLVQHNWTSNTIGQTDLRVEESPAPDPGIAIFLPTLGTSNGTISTCEVSSLPANVVPAMREKDAAPDKYCTVEIDRVLSQLAYCKFQNGKFSAAEPAGKRPGAP